MYGYQLRHYLMHLQQFHSIGPLTILTYDEEGHQFTTVTSGDTPSKFLIIAIFEAPDTETGHINLLDLENRIRYDPNGLTSSRYHSILDTEFTTTLADWHPQAQCPDDGHCSAWILWLLENFEGPQNFPDSLQFILNFEQRILKWVTDSLNPENIEGIESFDSSSYKSDDSRSHLGIDSDPTK